MPQSQYPPDLTESFKALSTVLGPEEDVDNTLSRIAALSVATVPGCDYAGISLVEPTGIRTVGYTHEIVKTIDDLQYETDQGPCLSAIRDLSRPGAAMIYEMASTSDETRWPEFATRAARSGLGSLLAFTLLTPDRTLGSLNLYARYARAFSPADRDVGVIFAAHASVALANAQTLKLARERVDELLEGYSYREVIGQAKGILMEREGCTEEEAFDILKRVSQGLHKKLRYVAEDVIGSTAPHDEPVEE